MKFNAIVTMRSTPSGDLLRVHIPGHEDLDFDAEHEGATVEELHRRLLSKAKALKMAGRRLAEQEPFTVPKGSTLILASVDTRGPVQSGDMVIRSVSAPRMLWDAVDRACAGGNRSAWVADAMRARLDAGREPTQTPEDEAGL